MNLHSLTFYGPPTADHLLQGPSVQTRSSRGRLSPPKSSPMLTDTDVPAARNKEELDDLALPVMKKGARLPTTRSVSSGQEQELPLNQVAKKDEPGTFARKEATDEQRLIQVPNSSNRPSTVTAYQRSSTTGSMPTPPRRSSCEGVPAALSACMRRRSSYHASPPSLGPERRPSSSSESMLSGGNRSDTVLNGGNQPQRRRSSRKSVSGLGLVIEFDLDDESECTLFAGCDDYEEDWRPAMNRQDSKESLEELRTRLEALEHEQQQEQLPEHDDSGLGEECVNKKFLEAMESSSNSLHTLNGSSLASLRISFAASQGGLSLLGIPEAVLESDDDDSGEVEHTSIKAQRHSTARLSIHGLVMEYDWSSASEGEHEEEHAQEEDTEDN